MGKTKRSSPLSKLVAHVQTRLDSRPVAHFIHVGKTAGTALTVALSEVRQSGTYRLVLHPHQTRLRGIPEEDSFFFCVRDPIDRYLSGFLSRQQQGRPRYHIPWSPEEAEAFSRFSSPDALAVALSDGGTAARQAEEAMRVIRHVRSSYWDWFHDPDYFTRRSDHLIWIGRQESLDLPQLAAQLGIGEITLPEDPIVSHRNLEAKPELSDLARRNLREWYAAEYEFLDLCTTLFPQWSRTS